MASLHRSYPHQIGSTRYHPTISPILQKQSRSSLRSIPKTRFLFRGSIQAISSSNSNRNDVDHDQRSVDRFKLVRRNLLISALGSKMSEIPPAFGDLEIFAAAESTSKKQVDLTEFPITLDSVISVTVPRPKKCRTKEEKEEEEEVLAIQGIEFVADELVKFDVHVNDDEDDLSRPDNSEFAGSFVYLPHRRKTVTTSMRLGITDLLDDMGADGDDSIKVTLVPKHVKRPVTIGKIKIEFLK
ncbi:polyphenol oxidase, chloroplastic-like [Argentina anserina]|uniref:polyphenol oxidase, chloroplastic-like n=1 Tax=Argentina anserina TaxID=57926 RepID=UPI002176337C|nr:polyphenol oxidase, chloroplastic-like [Potentilla anserina]